MNKDLYKKLCEDYKVSPFKVRVEWYTGDITRETVIAQDENHYFFDVSDRGSYYAPKSFCQRWCVGCEDWVEVVGNEYNVDLCPDCEDIYCNATGWCGLSCCLGNGCDNSC